MKSRSSNKRFFAVLVGVTAWREREAQTRDVPRNRILKDEALLEIAAHPPATSDALEGPLPEGMPPPERRRWREPSPAALDLLKTLLRLRAHQNRVAPRLVAGSDDLERLAAGDDEGVAALHGWRAEVFGNDAVALREGRLAIALENGEAVVIEPGAERRARARQR